jgi:hypothetical protein
METAAMWTNADEVKAFIEGHKDGRWLVGDKFVLPDIEQAYEVVAVRPFKHRGKFKLFVDLDAQCAVEGCGEYFIATKEVHQWMSSPYLVRCCQEHRGGFSTPMRDAWKTQEQIAARPPSTPKVKATPPPRIGPNERAVLDALEDLSVVADRARFVDVIELAISKLAKDDKRDTRKQRVVRAINSLAKSQRITLRGGVVLL